MARVPSPLREGGEERQSGFIALRRDWFLSSGAGVLFCLLTCSAPANPYATPKRPHEGGGNPVVQQPVQQQQQQSVAQPVLQQQQQQQQPEPQNGVQPPDTSRGQIGLTAGANVDEGAVRSWKWEADPGFGILAFSRLLRTVEEDDPRLLGLFSLLRQDDLRDAADRWFFYYWGSVCCSYALEHLGEIFIARRDQLDDLADRYRSIASGYPYGSTESRRFKGIAESLDAAADQADYYVDYPEESASYRDVYDWQGKFNRWADQRAEEVPIPLQDVLKDLAGEYLDPADYVR